MSRQQIVVFTIDDFESILRGKSFAWEMGKEFERMETLEERVSVDVDYSFGKTFGEPVRQTI